MDPIKDKANQSIDEIVANLSKKLPVRLLATRDAPGGKTLTYLPWFQAVKILNHYCVWDYSIQAMPLGQPRYETRIKKGWKGQPDKEKIVQLGASIVLIATISIHCREGVLSRSGIGEELLESDAHGGPAKTCESEALRRAATKFGLMLSAYDGEYD